MTDVGLEEIWREVLTAYETLREKHEEFRIAAKEADLNSAGPELKVALQMRFHQRRFQLFLEDLLYEEYRRGGLTRVRPPEVPQENKEGQAGKTRRRLKKHQPPSTEE